MWWVCCRGKGDYHRLGHGTDDHVRRPRRVTALQGKKIVSIACGSLHCVAVSDSGQLSCHVSVISVDCYNNNNNNNNNKSCTAMSCMYTCATLLPFTVTGFLNWNLFSCHSTADLCVCVCVCVSKCPAYVLYLSHSLFNFLSCSFT